MPINTLPTAPSRSQLPADFALSADAFVAALAPWGVSVQATGDQAALDAATASTNAGDAAASATAAALASAVAAASANYKGEWSSLSGALSKPASVSRAGVFYALLNNLANVAASQPGVSADWILVDPAIATQAEMEAGTEVTARTMSPLGVKQSIAAEPLGGGIELAPVGGGALPERNKTFAFLTGGTYTLPDLTARKSFALMALANSPAAPGQVMTSNGWTIPTGFSANTLRIIAPLVQPSPTPHGIWGASTVIPPVLGTRSTGGVGFSVVGSASLSASLAVVMLYTGSLYAVVAVNTATGDIGAIVALPGNPLNNSNLPALAIYTDTASTFVCFFSTSGPDAVVLAGSVSGVTVTLGTSASLGSPLVDTPVQLTPGKYLAAVQSVSDLRAVSVSGTAVTVGTAAASGSPVTANVGGGTRIARASATTALVVYPSTAVAPTSLRARVVTVSGTATVSLGTAATASTAAIRVYAINFLRATAGTGGKFVACAADTGTGGSWYGLSVSGATVTIGAVAARSDYPAILSSYALTYIHPPAQPSIVHSASTLLFGHLASGPFAVSISGTTLTFGASGGPTGATKFLTDFAGTSFYAVGTSAYDALSVAGTTVTSTQQVAGVPTIIGLPTVNNTAVNYGGTWYSWMLPTNFLTAITATRWLQRDGSLTLNLLGDIY